MLKNCPRVRSQVFLVKPYFRIRRAFPNRPSLGDGVPGLKDLLLLIAELVLIFPTEKLRLGEHFPVILLNLLLLGELVGVKGQVPDVLGPHGVVPVLAVEHQRLYSVSNLSETGRQQPQPPVVHSTLTAGSLSARANRGWLIIMVAAGDAVLHQQVGETAPFRADALEGEEGGV